MLIFLTSDALIHDCGSFMAEYLVVGKPALLWLEKSLLWNNGVLWSASNRGALSIEKPTAANRFYWKCGFKGQDEKRMRAEFVNNTLLNKNKVTASHEIMQF
jgi:hypothetical protein